MSIRIEGIEDLEAMLLGIESTARRRSVKTMISAGTRLQELAKQMAPVDDGDLEAAIKIDVTAARDDRGRFQTRNVSVYIDMDMPANKAGEKYKTVGDYAYFVHEHVMPAGPQNLGPKSVQKQMGQSVLVGGGFMERAADIVEEEFASAMNDAIDNL